MTELIQHRAYLRDPKTGTLEEVQDWRALAYDGQYVAAARLAIIDPDEDPATAAALSTLAMTVAVNAMVRALDHTHSIIEEATYTKAERA